MKRGYEISFEQDVKSAMSKVAIRKKRRGIIEKRRRDRINTSLTELRNILPNINQEKEYPKLEKAEILQQTVEHVKSLQCVSNLVSFGDTWPISVDYHKLGFQECIKEVHHFFAVNQEIDNNNSTWYKLVTHLQNKLNQNWTFEKLSFPALFQSEFDDFRRREAALSLHIRCGFDIMTFTKHFPQCCFKQNQSLSLASFLTL